MENGQDSLTGMTPLALVTMKPKHCCLAHTRWKCATTQQHLTLGWFRPMLHTKHLAK